MIHVIDNAYVMHTEKTSYIFELMPNGYCRHLYYGKRLNIDADTDGGMLDVLRDNVKFIPGCTIEYSKDNPNIALENECLEYSSIGKGDVRDAQIVIENVDGSLTGDFICDKIKVFNNLASVSEGRNESVSTTVSEGRGESVSETVSDGCDESVSKTEDESQAVAETENSAETSDSITEKIIDKAAAFTESVKDKIEEKFEEKLGIVKDKTDAENLPLALINLPAAKEPDAQLKVILKSRWRKVSIEIYYNIFYKENVISRAIKVVNGEDEKIKIDRALSLQLDLYDGDYDFVTFNGAWVREMNKSDMRVANTRLVNSSNMGTSGNKSNPFTILKESTASEDAGDCYGFNLVYSGNHYTSVAKNSFGKIRVLAGINPEGFQYELSPGESFEGCEAVMTYSHEGLNGMSRNMHRFVRNRIVRGAWANKVRPVVFNSWEACYFKIDEKKLLDMARFAKDVGCEVFVMDDGWFGKRNDDKTSLGDWEVNRSKLPNGLDGLVEKVNQLGLGFGIWVEPEMVNVSSELYRKHPDWVVGVPGMPHSEGRNQRILDLTRRDVRDYVVEKISDILSSANIVFVKWDMNRIFSDMYSSKLTNQKEFGYRYILGLYDIMGRITSAFPKILFEGCASGGNRFDLGVMCYMPQIWASDNTDAWCRAVIQNNISYGYPMSVVSAHVSGSPNHQTLRSMSLSSRFNVAAGCVLGLESNIADWSARDRQQLKGYIEIYKENRAKLIKADYYRIDNGRMDDYGRCNYQWCIVSTDKSVAYLVTMQDKAIPNLPDYRAKLKGLDNKALYCVSNVSEPVNIKAFGDLINTVTPVHIKPDSLVHNVVSRRVKMNGEKDEYLTTGEILNNCGFKTTKNYSSVGFGDDVRFYQDYSSRLYVIKKVEQEGRDYDQREND